jgi:hypothetical protein
MGNQNPPPNPIGTQSNTVDLYAAEDSAPSNFTSNRSLGRDSSKEKAKKQRSENTSSTDSEYLTRMGELSLCNIPKSQPRFETLTPLIPLFHFILLP